MTEASFRELVERLARAWSTQDTELGVACFTHDAVYTEPPDIQLYQGHDQLRPYFAALEPGTFMRLHTVGFDAVTGRGLAEYSFGSESSETAVHGVAVVEVEDGRIARWREYQQRGPASFDEFTATEGKSWKWHIGNYP
jgi:limonene-1,2-epoxide hydrolase